MTFWDRASRSHRDMVRDLIGYPDHRLYLGYMSYATISKILSEREEWLKTKKGKRMLALAEEHRKLLEEP